MKDKYLQMMLKEKVIADLEFVRGEECLNLVDALRRGGIRIVSITVADRNNIQSELETN